MPAPDLEAIAVGRDRVVLHLAGEVELDAAYQLRQCLIELVDGGARHVLADLRDVTSLDSTGMGALVGGFKQVRAREGSFTLVTGDERILGVLRRTRLDRVFMVGLSVQEAITGDQDWRDAVTGEGDTVEQWCRRHGLL
jgi:anti-sigma B factor antagonist